MELPLIIFEDLKIEGRMAEYLSSLAERTHILSPFTNTQAEIDAAKPKAFAWVSRITPLRPGEFPKMTALKLISAWGVGYNHINLAEATGRKIPVCYNPVFSRSMAESALLFILGLSKRLPQLSRDALTGRPPKETERGVEIFNKTLGLVGFGRIGLETGDLCRRMDMKVIAFDPYQAQERMPEWCRLVTLKELLEAADFVVITAPLTPETRHLIGAQELERMKSEAYLINIARGPLVDEKALLEALKGGRISGAGIDVWEEEPLKPENPLLHLDNVIATPHKIGATWQSLQRVCQAIQNNIYLVLEGKPPLNVINPGIYKT